MTPTRTSRPRTPVAAVLRFDLPASLVVFLVAVPLSLGVAMASGAPLLAGLVAAVVGGVVVGLVGGSPLQVSGPAAGLTVVVADLVTRFGWATMAVVTIAAGLLQIAFGLAGVARFAAAIPPAVVHGMLAGIGVTIALSQLHVVLGGPPRTGAWDSVAQLPGQLLGLHGPAVLVGLVTIAVVLGWGRLPRQLRAVPGPLVGVLAATGLAALWPDVPRVDLPGGLLDAVAPPTFPLPGATWSGVALGVLTVAVVASVESLLSAVAVDRMHDGPRTDPDRELVGQGAANSLSGLLGGLPVTGVIVRSSTNVRAGARTRASTVLHGAWVAVFGIALVGVVEMVPLAALAGLLVLVGVQLVKLADIRTARRHGDLALYLATALGVLLFTLLEGVALGLAVAGLTVLLRAVRARIGVTDPGPGGGPVHVVVRGALSFLAVPALSAALARVPAGAVVRVDLVVDYMDHTAFDHLDGWARAHRLTGGEVTVDEPGRPGSGRRWPHSRFATWSEWQSRHPDLDGTEPAPGAATAALLAGLAAYHAETAPDIRPVMRELADGQRPSGLLLACADSRVVPNMITHSGPGDLFTVQNVGNMVSGTGTHAAVQYATTVLGVPLIAVCGHAGCGAMQALLARARPGGFLRDWLDTGTPSLLAFRSGHPVGRAALAEGRCEVDALAMVNVAVQLDVLRRHGANVELVGLFYDIPTARVLVLDADGVTFSPVVDDAGAGVG
ncbi:SulP family inorganic anion transporter [Pseudonocardia lacus]|uniref:SulP family inorganic anion transporter n=1 Tax=Pseudonocardia lacus TaxID=2835865 RepID=UPI0027E27A49|nr:SulP family inorganic anion transporter [Pseudonocardia lacus]